MYVCMCEVFLKYTLYILKKKILNIKGKTMSQLFNSVFLLFIIITRGQPQQPLDLDPLPFDLATK